MKVQLVIYAALLFATSAICDTQYYYPGQLPWRRSDSVDDVVPSKTYSESESDLNLSNLGTVISRQVAQHVSGVTSTLNQQISDINRNVQRQMKSLHEQLQTNMRSFNADIQHNLQGLNKAIEQRVQQSLEPVNAMMVRSAMAHGVGGTTIALYGGRTQVIMTNGNRYTCTGQMVKDPITEGVKCTVNMQYISAQDTDVCIDNSYSKVNNIYCFGNYASFICIDTSCQCRGGNMHTLDYLKSVCGDSYGTGEYVKYDYYPNPKDRNRIPIPHPNKHVTCEEDSSPEHCLWHGNGFILAATDYSGANM